MKPDRADREDFERRYVDTLQDYLRGGGEAALQEAYKLGRRAIADGLGVLDMAGIYQGVMTTILNETATAEKRVEDARRAGEFFAESMAPFEMTHRTFEEARSALAQLNETLEEEAKRIAHSLHDEAGQLLAAVHIKLDEVARGLTPQIRERLQEVRELLDQIEGQLRQLSHELRPTVLDDLGLVPALEFLAGGVSKRTKLVITVDGSKGKRLPAPIETALYRIVQEALNNVTKHARATRVNVQLRYTNEGVSCSVRDDGIGFEPSDALSRTDGRGLGLIGIRERLNALGGAVQILSAPRRGTELQITVPIGR